MLLGDPKTEGDAANPCHHPLVPHPLAGEPTDAFLAP